ncbi:MAG: hypothetical protein LBU70_00745 [Chitinispirillales bacterium]|jgi:uncharacterized protein (TIGR02145 family)|nr:hypothetical protein [Chitinispirillales bacterium]
MYKVKIVFATASVMFAVLLLSFAISCSGEDGRDGISGVDGHGCVITDDPDNSAYLIITCGSGDNVTTERLARAMCGAEAYDPRWGFVCRKGRLTFTDERDNQHYKIVRIGEQVWMAENLNWAGANGNLGWCYSPSVCNTRGRLYDWSMVMGFSSSCNDNDCDPLIQPPHRGICPIGWHVPSDSEWATLVNFVGSDAGTKLKSTSGWWNDEDNGTDDYGFSALNGGLRRGGDGAFMGIERGHWRTATEGSATTAVHRSMDDRSSVSRNTGSKDNAYSLRCVAD